MTQAIDGVARWSRSAIPALISAAVMLGLWEILVRWFAIPEILLPPPSRVAAVAWDQRIVLLGGFWVTARAALLGLLLAVIVGTLIGIIFSQARWMRAAFYPYVIFLQTVPIVAIAPLLVVWSGYQPRTVVLISAIICLFPIVSNVTTGLMSIDRNLKDMMRLYSAGRWNTLIKLRIPTAIGHLVLGLRISGGLAVIGAIMGDFFVGSGSVYKGLGRLMTDWQSQQRTPALMAAVAASTLLGLLMFAAINVLSQRLLKRWIAETS
jgi:NitT/TauT family transport system permease protein